MDPKTIKIFTALRDAIDQGLANGETGRFEANNDEVVMCNEHGVPMQISKYPSKKTGERYPFHDDPTTDQRCFGKGYRSKNS